MGLSATFTGSGTIGTEIGVGWTAEEQATPLDATDSSAGTGLVRFGAMGTPLSPFIINNRAVITESVMGEIDGVVTEARIVGSGVNVTVNAIGYLMVGEQTAPPTGSQNLSQIFESYVALSTSLITVSYQASSNPVRAYPGWKGEVWYFLKQLAAINKVEIAFIGLTMIVRDIGVTTYVLDDSEPVDMQIGSSATGLAVAIVNQNAVAASPTTLYNFSANPSVETNATNWSATIGAYGTITSGRAT